MSPRQGSRLVRWAAVEAVQVLPHDVKLRHDRERITARRGRNIGKVAAARKLLTLVFYGLRDGHIRCLDQTRRMNPPYRVSVGNRRRVLAAGHDPRCDAAWSRL